MGGTLESELMHARLTVVLKGDGWRVRDGGGEEESVTFGIQFVRSEIENVRGR